MVRARTHLTVLETAAKSHPSAPAFKVPIASDHEQDWRTITYGQFFDDVERCAKYWTRTFRDSGIPYRAVIGLWVGGWTYDDLVHIYGVSRAGYVPQLFTINLPNPKVILELLHKADARALIHDTRYESVLGGFALPVYPASEVSDLGLEDARLVLKDSHVNVDMEETVFYFHTSGSTSGSPKVVPYSYRWLESAIHKSDLLTRPARGQRQEVTTWLGSMCHIGQTFMVLGSMIHGICTIVPTAPGYSSDEFSRMITHCGLTRVNQFASFLEPRLRAAQADRKLAALLQGLDDIICCGLLSREAEDWAWRNGVSVRNLFGSTECGATLISNGGHGPDAPHLRAIDPESTFYSFQPITSSSTNTTESTSATAYDSTARMLEFVVNSNSPDCPPGQVFRSAVDGQFHTGDLFQEVSPGSYVFRGRDDDWIKSQNSLRCDTKAIEDNARAACGGLIAECIVVGSGRPSPAIFIESAAEIDHLKLKKEVIRKTRQFHSRRYVHERIVSTDLVIIVPPMSLPRTATKGNIRRKAVEEQYRELLDGIYEKMAR